MHIHKKMHRRQLILNGIYEDVNMCDVKIKVFNNIYIQYFKIIKKLKKKFFLLNKCHFDFNLPLPQKSHMYVVIIIIWFYFICTYANV